MRRGAGRCVACGMCLPHCPTYRKTKSELESPRGRLSLILALSKGELPPSATLESHLSLCLLCRACESVCPAGVPFAETMDAARAQLGNGRRQSLRRRLGLRAMAALARPHWAGVVAGLLWFYQKSGAQKLARRTGALTFLRLAQAEAELPAIAPITRLATFYPAQTKRRAALALFTGCIARLADVQTLRSTIRVLTQLGYDVHVPRAQGCCGALHRHAGDTAGADALLRRNLDAFDTDRPDLAFGARHFEAIITTASGCATELLVNERLAAKVIDVSAFLANVEWPPDIAFQPLAKRVAVHDPCTLVNSLRTREAPYALLKRIPQAEIVALAGNNQCCGAAGAYHLEHPEMAQQLRDDKIEALLRLAPDILVTSNIGCAMFIAAGIRATGRAVEVVHPVTLIARQMKVQA